MMLPQPPFVREDLNRVNPMIRKLKVFRVLKETYRHRRRRFGLRLNLIAALYNHDLDAV